MNSVFKLICFSVFVVSVKSSIYDWIHLVTGRESRKIDELSRIYNDTEKNLDISGDDGVMKYKESFITYSLTKTINTKGFYELTSAIRNGFYEKSSCVVCHIFMLILKSRVPKSVLANSFTATCISFKILKPDECVDLINSFVPLVDHIRKNSNLTVDEMCGVLFGVQCAFTITNNLNWTIDLPPKTRFVQCTNRSLDSRGYFLQVTDTHGDNDYSENGCGKCDRIVCCDKLSGQCKDKEQAGNWSDYRKCDTQKKVIEEVFTRMKLFTDAKFVVISGDYVKHNVHTVTTEEVIQYVKDITEFASNHLNGFKVFITLGNHESVPVNCIAPSSVKNALNSTWIHELAASLWVQFLPKSAVETMAKDGYYKVDIDENTVILHVNSNFCARLNFWLLVYPIDCGGQLKWLTDELFNAENTGKKAYIVMHIPPDNRECTEAWTWNYIRIIERFQDTVFGQIFGHRHFSEYRVILSLKNEGRVIGLQYLTPSVTTFSGSNTAFRQYFVNNEGYIVDYVTHYLPLDEANNGVINWKKDHNSLGFQLENLQNFDAFCNGKLTEKQHYDYCSYCLSYATNELINCSDSKNRKIFVNDVCVREPYKYPLKGLDF